MRISRIASVIAGVIFSSALGGALRAQDSAAPALPAFAEVYGLVRSNLVGMSETELNRAAVLGFLGQLQSQVTLLTNSVEVADTSDVPLIGKVTVFENAYGFVRVGRVGAGLPKAFATAYEQVHATNKLKGLIVDLRFAIGQDYRAAAETSDLFFSEERPLLQWGNTTVQSTTKTNAIDLPVVILVNRYTSGAAEGLAAALRQAEGGVLIGASTAGHAYLSKEVRLSTGAVLHIASGSVAGADGKKLPENGLQPDIVIAVSFEDEKAYFEDPYRTLAKPFAQAVKPGTNEVSALQNLNRSRRRINEAELVRMQREGVDLDGETWPTNSSPQVNGPVISDPALSRALDLLKGLALALKRR